MNLSLFDEGSGGRSEERVFRVAEINRAVRTRLESDWRNIWIEGELSNVKRSAPGHVYFTLHDEDAEAQLSCVMYRSDVVRTRIAFENGARVRVRGTLTIYEPKGSFQFTAKIAKPIGAGELAAQFLRIREKLEAEGLFDSARKRPLPRFPRTIGIVTSRGGAALKDIIRVAADRSPVRLIVADCRVQGEGSIRSVRVALAAIQRVPEVEVVIVARGGGAAEDLWTFNDEELARELARCRVPTISAIGHESDITILDLVADVRAATPSNAAEIAVPDRRALQSTIDELTRHLRRSMETELQRRRLGLERLRVTDPRHDIRLYQDNLSKLRDDLARQVRMLLTRDRRRLLELHQAVARHDARTSLTRKRGTLRELERRHASIVMRRLSNARSQLTGLVHDMRASGDFPHAHRLVFAELVARLEAMSPLSVLARGYAIAFHETTGRAIRRASEAPPGTRLRLRLAEGSLPVRVESDPE